MNENKMIDMCRQGDVGAYKWIFDRYQQPLLHTATRILGHQQDAEDAVQTAFINLYRGIHNFKGQSKFSTYLFRILMNVCFDRLDKKKKMKMHSLENVQKASQPKQDLQIILTEAVDTLPPQMKACFVMFAIEGFKQTEIAEIMNLSLGGVKSNIFHAKNKLKILLTDSFTGDTR